MLKLVLGRINSGKTTYVHGILGECLKAGEQPLYMIVPEQFSFESEKKILTLFGERAAQKIEVCGFSRLAQNILGDTADLKRPGSAGRVVVMSMALEQVTDKLQVYGRYSRSVGVISEMLKVYDEMIKCSVSSADLESAAHKLPQGMLRKKLEDLSNIVAAYDAIIAQRFPDEHDSLTALYEYLAQQKSFAGATVVIDGFKGFTQQELDIISRIVAQSKDTYITLCTDSVFGGEYDISPFACVRKTAKQLLELAKREGVSVGAYNVPKWGERYSAPCLEHLEASLYSSTAQPFEGSADEVTLFSAGTVYQECEYVALSIKKLLRERNYRCRDIAVIARSEGEYSKLLRAALKKHDVPVFEDKRRPMAVQPLVVLVRASLEISARGFSGDAIFRLLKTQLAGLTVEQTSELEEYAYLWSIDGSDWLKEWKENPSGLGNAPTQKDSVALEGLNAMRLACVQPLVRFREAAVKADGKGIIKALYNYLVEIKAPQNLKKLAVALNAGGEQTDALEMGRVWDRLMDIFDSMAIALGQDSIKPARMLELFMLVLSVQDMGVIPGSLDEIVIGSADRIRFNRPRAVFVVGVNDGVFPKNATGGRVLGDADRHELKEIGLNVAEPSQFAFLEERYIAYNALCSAGEQLYVSYYQTDFSGAEGTPSELIGQLQRLLPKCKRLDSSCLGTIDYVESEASAFELAARGWNNDTSLEATLKTHFASSEKYAPQVEALNRACNKKSSEIEDKTVALGLFGNDIYASATRIEDYHKCPFLFYCRHGLKLNERRVAQIDSMLGGTIVHYVLENIVKRHGKGLVQLNTEQLRAYIALLLDEFSAENMGGESEKGERFSFLYARMCDSLYAVVTRLINEMKHSRFVPQDFELQIGGSEGKIKEYEIDLPDGGKILLNGKVDRVDVYKTENETFLRVIDYKTGSKVFNLVDVLNGLNMQMLLYLFAIRANGGECYGQVIPAGVLYFPAKSVDGEISRDADKERIEQEIVSDGKMSGLIVDMPEIIEATDIDGTGNMITGKKGIEEHLISLEALGKLESYMRDIVRKMGMRLHDGKIPAMPTYTGEEKTKPCNYCKYRDICLHEDSDEESVYGSMKMSDCIELLYDEEGEV